MSNDQLPHSLPIATEIKRMIAAGVTMQVIFDKIKTMTNAPRSLTTFYKIYRDDISSARALLHEGIGSKIMEKALKDGDSRMLELVAKAKLGWSEKVIVEEAEQGGVEEQTSAIDDLIAALNIREKKSNDDGQERT